MSTYCVVLFRLNRPAEVVQTGLSLDEAKAICSDPETSSRTATDPNRYDYEPWFFGFREEG